MGVSLLTKPDSLDVLKRFTGARGRGDFGGRFCVLCQEEDRSFCAESEFSPGYGECGCGYCLATGLYYAAVLFLFTAPGGPARGRLGAGCNVDFFEVGTRYDRWKRKKMRCQPTPE